MSFWKKLFGGQDDTATMVVECPFCKQPVTADKKLAGVTVSCPNSACAREFLIPAELFQKPPATLAPASPGKSKATPTCGACGRPVKATTRPKPDWYDRDQVDWQCRECHGTFCGECSAEKLQQLKKKYGVTGVSLKAAVNNDPMALYEGWELEPTCPHCKFPEGHRKRTLDVLRTEDTAKSRETKPTSKKPDRARAKILNDEGIAAAQRGNSELAMQKLQAAIDADPTWGTPWNNLGVVYRDMGANGEAMKCLAKAMQLGI